MWNLKKETARYKTRDEQSPSENCRKRKRLLMTHKYKKHNEK
jgi:hypothetical protein